MNEVSILNLSYGNYVSLDDYMKLKQENKQLKEQKNKALNYIKNYNFMEFRYQDSKVIDKLNIVKNILNNRLDFEDEDIEIIKLKDQLKQKDEVIDEAIKYIYNRKEQGIYENHNLLGILQKYKGDNK